MDTFEAIETRRAVKHFDPTHKMTDEETDKLMSSVLLSPTAFNIQNWRFVLVKDPNLREQIRQVAWDQAQVTDASLLIILCADLKCWEKNPERCWRNAPKEVQEFMIPAIDQYYRDRERVQQDEAMRSCGIAAQTLMLAATSMGYDSCPMDGFDMILRKINQFPDCVIVNPSIGQESYPIDLVGGIAPDPFPGI